ncbi:hypothetical protein G6514_007667 [Epicoccum nigrum]|nr:hypothetical protein G6514_007667 [Epicoccum nigrum]
MEVLEENAAAELRELQTGDADVDAEIAPGVGAHDMRDEGSQQAAEHTGSKSRRWPCHILREHGIPCVVWFEDAIAFHGVPTVVFDLYILVPDISTAADVLVRAGWKPVQQEKAVIGGAEVEYPQRRLLSATAKKKHEAYMQEIQRPLPPGHIHASDTTDYTVLLPAADWNFCLSKTERPEENVFPPLAGLVDALIDSLLDCPRHNYLLRCHLAVHLTSLYDCAPALKEKAFAEQMRYEHRQYHFDVLAGMDHGTLPFIAHQRHIREALRQGTHELAECSTSRDNKLLFSKAVQARLLASMRKPVVDMEECSSDDDWGVYDNPEEIEEKYQQLVQAAKSGVTMTLKTSDA